MKKPQEEPKSPDLSEDEFYSIFGKLWPIIRDHVEKGQAVWFNPLEISLQDGEILYKGQTTLAPDTLEDQTGKLTPEELLSEALRMFGVTLYHLMHNDSELTSLASHLLDAYYRPAPLPLVKVFLDARTKKDGQARTIEGIITAADEIYAAMTQPKTEVPSVEEPAPTAATESNSSSGIDPAVLDRVRDAGLAAIDSMFDQRDRAEAARDVEFFGSRAGTNATGTRLASPEEAAAFRDLPFTSGEQSAVSVDPSESMTETATCRTNSERYWNFQGKMLSFRTVVFLCVIGSYAVVREAISMGRINLVFPVLGFGVFVSLILAFFDQVSADNLDDPAVTTFGSKSHGLSMLVSIFISLGTRIAFHGSAQATLAAFVGSLAISTPIAMMVLTNKREFSLGQKIVIFTSSFLEAAAYSAIFYWLLPLHA